MPHGFERCRVTPPLGGLSPTRRALARALLSLLLGLGPAASAAPAAPLPSVVLIDHGSGSLARRIRAELSFIGWAVLAPAPGTVEEEDAAALSGAAGDALIRVISDSTVEVYVAGSDTQRTDSRWMRARHGEEEMFPVKVVEELRARLVALGFELPDDPAAALSERAESLPMPGAPEPAPRLPAVPEATARDAVEPPPADTSPAAPLALGAHGGLGGVLAAGGLSPAFAGALGLSLQSGQGLRLRLSTLLPLGTSELSEPEGEAEVSVRTFNAEAEYESAIAPHWAVSGGLGAGLLALSVQASADAPFVGSERRILSGLYYAHVGLARELASWLRLRISLAAGASGPRPVLRFDGHDVGSWGSGFGTLTLNTELRWPLTESASP